MNNREVRVLVCVAVNVNIDRVVVLHTAGHNVQQPRDDDADGMGCRANSKNLTGHTAIPSCNDPPLCPTPYHTYNGL